MDNQLTGSTLTAQDLLDIDQKIQELEQLVAGKLANLTPQERQKYGSVGEQNKLFVNKVFDFAQSNPTNPNITSDVNWPRFAEEHQMRQYLETRINRIESIAYGLQSSKISYDYNNYQCSLIAYRFLEYRASIKKPGAIDMLNDIGQFFEKNAPHKNKPAI